MPIEQCVKHQNSNVHHLSNILQVLREIFACIFAAVILIFFYRNWSILYVVSYLHCVSKFLHCWKAYKICYKPIWHYPPHLRHVATVKIWQSYREFKGRNFFETHCIWEVTWLYHCGSVRAKCFWNSSLLCHLFVPVNQSVLLSVVTTTLQVQDRLIYWHKMVTQHFTKVNNDTTDTSQWDKCLLFVGTIWDSRWQCY